MNMSRIDDPSADEYWIRKEYMKISDAGEEDQDQDNDDDDDADEEGHNKDKEEENADQSEPNVQGHDTAADDRS